MADLTIRNRNQQVSVFSRSSNFPSHLPSGTWGNIPAGDRFVALGFRPKLTLCYEPEKWSHDDYIRDLEHDLQITQPLRGSFHREHFVGLEDKIIMSPYPKIEQRALFSAEPIQDPSAWRRPSLNTLSEFCPSLDSDHGGSTDVTEDDDTTAKSENAIGIPTAFGPSSMPQESPPLYSTIHRVFSSESSFARRLIAALKRLANDEQNLLIGHDNECVDGSPSGPSKADERPSKKRKADSKRSNERANSDRLNENGVGKDDEGDDDREKQGDGKSPTTDLKGEQKNAGWICPYPLVYPGMHLIPRFKSCFAINMIHKGEWKMHLAGNHSPTAKSQDRNAEKHAKYYMSKEKLEGVLLIFKNYTHKPRDPDARTNQLKTLFNEVWGKIFPEHEFPDVQKPPSPFHDIDSESPNLEQHLQRQVKLLLRVINETRAKEALAANRIASTSDYHPTQEQMEDNMSKALTLILLNSPAAARATETLSRAPLDAVETVGQYHKDNTASQSMCYHYGEAIASNINTGAIPPSSAIMPQMPLSVLNGISTIPTQSVLLFKSGTLLELKPDPSRPQSGGQNAFLNLPETYYVETMRPLPSPPDFAMNQNMMQNQNPTPFVPIHLSHQTPENASVASWSQEVPDYGNQAVSMREVQGGPSGQAEIDIQGYTIL